MQCLKILIYGLVGTSTFALAEEAPEYYLDQFAPSAEERAGWQDARQLFEEFLATPEFIGRDLTDQDNKVHAALDDACVLQTDIKACEIHIRQHRAQILTALPDNPLYWLRFRSLLQVNPHTFLTVDQPTTSD